MKVVLFIGDSPLYLRDVKRDGEGNIKSGFVENGLWHLCIKDGVMYCSDEYGNVVTERDISGEVLKEVVIPEGMKFKAVWNEYNEVIFWAEEQLRHEEVVTGK